MTTSTSPSLLRRLRWIVVALVLLPALIMIGLSWKRGSGEVTLTFADVALGAKGYEASFILRNDTGRSIFYSEVLVRPTNSSVEYWVPVTGPVMLSPGEELACQATIHAVWKDLVVEGYLLQRPRPSLQDRLLAALPAKVKFWEDPSAIKWEDFGDLVISDPFVPTELVPAAEPALTQP